jgi:hypothetical protein
LNIALRFNVASTGVDLSVALTKTTPRLSPAYNFIDYPLQIKNNGTVDATNVQISTVQPEGAILRDHDGCTNSTVVGAKTITTMTSTSVISPSTVAKISLLECCCPTVKPELASNLQCHPPKKNPL